MANTNNKKPQKSAKDAVLGYLPGFCAEIAHKFGYKYGIGTSPDSAAKWRSAIEPYDVEIEKWAIKQMCSDLIHLASNSANATNLDFLRKVAKELGKYMANYAIRNPQYNLTELDCLPTDDAETKKDKRRTKHDYVYQIMFRMLYTENPFITRLQKNQEQKRQDKQETSKERRNRECVARVKRARALSKDIRNAFREAAMYKKPKKH